MICGGVAQLVERSVRIREVMSSNLTVSTKQPESGFARFGFYFFIKSIGQKDYAGKKPHG